MFIDCHNHLQDPRFDHNRADLISAMREEGITRCIVNGTTEADWPAVTKLAQEHPDLITPSYGLHPWYLDQRSDRWQQSLRDLLTANPSAVIGECGLDRWIKNYDLDLQCAVFRTHLELAAELARPVTIHCLKAWGPLHSALKECPNLPSRILLHSFSGSLESARELLQFGAYFSFSGYFLHPKKEKLRKIFQQLPPDRILIETDAPDMLPPSPKFSLADLNHPANLPDIARQAAESLHLPVDRFARNAQEFFNL